MAPPTVVIGAGHHGLVAAIRLAERGRDVVVLEGFDRPGGGVRSAELTRPGFVHDTCSGFFPLAAASPVFRELELGLHWINPAVAMVHLLDGEGRAIALHGDVEATARSLDLAAPGAGRGWRELVQTLWPHREALIRAGLSPLPAIGPTARLLAGLRLQAVSLAPLAPASSATLGRRVLGSEVAGGWLASTGAHADLSPRAVGSGVFGLGLNFLGHVVGWPFPAGGAGRLTDALVDRLRSLGGVVRCTSTVEAIELTSGQVRAVRLGGGERMPVRSVICTASPAVLMRMLGPGRLPGRLERRLRSWRYGLGTLKLDWALSGPAPWSAAVAREAGVVQLGGSLGQVVSSVEQALGGRFPDHPAAVVGQQSLHDPTRAPSTQHTLYAYVRVPQRSALDPEEMAERVEEEIEHYAPGFRRLIVGRSVRTPSAIEAENPSMAGGDLASGSCVPNQQVMFRPAPELCRGHTPIRGLYVAGGWVHPGPGVHGVSGWAAAHALLRRRRWC